MDVTCDVMIIISRTNGHLWDEQWLGHINTGWQLCCYYETLVVLLSPHWFFSHSETDYKQLQQETGHPEAEDVACSSVWGNPSTNNRSWTLYSHFTNGCILFLMDLKWLKLHHDFLRHFRSSVSNLWGSGSLMWLSVSEDKQQISHFLKSISVLSQTDCM